MGQARNVGPSSYTPDTSHIPANSYRLSDPPGLINVDVFQTPHTCQFVLQVGVSFPRPNWDDPDNCNISPINLSPQDKHTAWSRWRENFQVQVKLVARRGSHWLKLTPASIQQPAWADLRSMESAHASDNLSSMELSVVLLTSTGPAHREASSMKSVMNTYLQTWCFPPVTRSLLTFHTMCTKLPFFCPESKYGFWIW